MNSRDIPRSVLEVMATLQAAGYQAYLVGGCVRDHLLDRTPRDYDIATDARPEVVRTLFAKTVPTGMKYGTVTVFHGDTEIEVTTFRADGTYSDGRRPDNVTFSDNIMGDLARRDFTINAMAWSPKTGVIDPFGGQKDLAQRLIRVVGSGDRLKEDALRMLRAVRLACTLKFNFDIDTWYAIRNHADLLRNVSPERIRDEFNLMLLAWPWRSLYLLRHLELFPYFMPEITAIYDFDQQTPWHRKNIWDHTAAVIRHLPVDLPLLLAGLFHDIAKPQTFSLDEHEVGHFYGHEELGADMAEEIMTRLRYDMATIQHVKLLVREHMFAPDMGIKAMRRLIARVGANNIPDLLTLRLADMRGSGVKHDTSHVDKIREVLADMQIQGIANPASDLAINGHDVMSALNLRPGPQVGKVLAWLQEKILDEPELNERGTLLKLLGSFQVETL